MTDAIAWRQWLRLLGPMAVLALGACVRPPEQPTAAVAPLPPQCSPSSRQPVSQRLTIDSSRSAVRVHVFRAGRLGHLGHNHIVAIRDISGFVELADPLRQSRFALCLPVAGFSIDDPELRVAAGAGFEKQPTPADIGGTRRNMLSESQLHGERFPYLVVTGTVIESRADQLNVRLEFTVRAHSHTTTIPVKWDRTQAGLTVQGDLSLNLTDLGIEPYSALFGALRVRDRLDLQFDLAGVTTGQ